MTVDIRDEGPIRHPQPEVPRLANLADRILHGDILLPKFQRAFVWNRRQVLELLDSVVKNYPIGSILLWQTNLGELASERTVAGLSVRPPRPGYPVNYILDGQQRLSTIFGALHWKPNEDPDSIWNIVYDLAEQKFMHRTTDDEPPMFQIPTRLLSDPADYFGRVGLIAEPELQLRAKQVFARFQDYSIAAIVLHDMPVDEVAKVFGRINSTGTPLDVVDLVRAATWTPDFDLTEEVDTLLAVLEAKKYGRIDRKTILRTIAAAAGLGFSNSDMDNLRRLSGRQITAAVGEVAVAARRAVDFLATQIGTPRAAALPYLNQFAPLVEVFRQVPKPTAAQFSAIHRWFWLTASGGYFKGWNSTQMLADCIAIAEFAAKRTADIEISVAVPTSNFWRRNQFRADNAPAKLLALLLAYEQPLDLRTGQRIDVDKALSWDNDKEFHHFFPRDFLRRARYSTAQINVCANFIMLSSVSNIWISNQPPSRYLRDLCDTEGEAEVRKRAATCLVDADAFAAAQRDDFEGFLRARSETLHQRLTALIGLLDSSGGAPKTVGYAEPDNYDAMEEPVDRDSDD
ncbi:DUF262 domain-containing protein [Micromonospora sp. S-DT3-3-22]|uniref:DUF262 domain-containing protein n=1 Tax=Micromonospora sp. S-DT3-3-22 TaxID=2755359 RepID=UPI00188ED8F8|nr:DUF262 domain-containing protein [Micromonospora sp. S-DT3-3-22]